MFPLRDDNPTSHVPVVTWVIIAINLLVWIFVQRMGTMPSIVGSVCRFGLIPGELLGTVPEGTAILLGRGVHCTTGPGGNWTTIISSMFLHGGWFHLISNMWFLAIFGDNVEDSLGKIRFALFYLACGSAAAWAQIAMDPSSTIPMVGASGAIGGVLGAYTVLFPKARVETLVFLGFFITIVGVPAIFMLGYWFFIQLISALTALGGRSEGGVAFFAHIGGFLAGIGLVYLLTSGRKPQHKMHLRFEHR